MGSEVLALGLNNCNLARPSKHCFSCEYFLTAILQQKVGLKHAETFLRPYYNKKS